MNPLKPCPFCLTDGDERLIELWDTFDAGHIAHIHCTHCGADGPSVYGEMGAAPTIARARSMWNGRAEYLKTPNAAFSGSGTTDNQNSDGLSPESAETHS